MSDAEWTHLLDGIFAAHGKAAPSDRIAAKWFEHVYDVPMKAAVDIARDFERSSKLDFNFGSQFLTAWRQWRASHPEYIAHEPAKVYGCKNCHGGTIWFARFAQNGLMVHGAALCLCTSPTGTTAEAIRSRKHGVGSYEQVMGWCVKHNREKTGFHAKYGSGESYNVAELVGNYRRARLGEEEAALMTADA